MTIKENVLYLKNVNLAIDKIAELEKENTELKKDKEWLDNTNNEQTKVILELQAQIEKMKCCGNCFHFSEHGDCEDCDGKNSAWEPEELN